MSVEFLVSEDGGKRFFQVLREESVFSIDSLEACVFEQCAPCLLRLYRGPAEQPESMHVYTIGTHGPMTYFDTKALVSTFDSASEGLDPSEIGTLMPDNFQPGDRILVDLRTSEEEFQLLDVLKRVIQFKNLVTSIGTTATHSPESP